MQYLRGIVESINWKCTVNGDSFGSENAVGRVQKYEASSISHKRPDVRRPCIIKSLHAGTRIYTFCRGCEGTDKILKIIRKETASSVEDREEADDFELT
ncbi:hypothetical protein TNCV_3729311 [Trichonephila clavipes]|nr:hypothetical protein TNCV_3729311 [Trichonephila clavipes]